MKITFLFGGALTAKQQAVVDGEIKAGNDVQVTGQVSSDMEYDLLVYGSGFRGLEDLADAVAFADYEVDAPIEEPKPVKKKKSRKSKTVAKSSGDE